jgi:hypothetical protein
MFKRMVAPVGSSQQSCAQATISEDSAEPQVGKVYSYCRIGRSMYMKPTGSTCGTQSMFLGGALQRYRVPGRE